MRRIRSKKNRQKKEKLSLLLVSFLLLSLLILTPLIAFLLNSTASKTHVYASTAAPHKYYYGVNWHPVWYDSTWISDNVTDMKSIGVGATRIDVPWDMIETQKGVYNQEYLANIDAAVNTSSTSGIRSLLIVNGAPGWANGGQNSITPPLNVQDYVDFLKFLIQRYAGKVHHYEIWNEPDGSWGWMTPDPAAYTNLLKAAYTGAKSVDPSIIILGGSLANPFLDNQNFLRGMYNAGAKDYFDILSQHTYGDPPGHGNLTPEETIDNVINNIVPIMNQYGDTNKKIWITEHGYNTSTTGVSEQEQADYLTRAYTRALTYPVIDSFYYYAWINSGGDGTDITQPEQNYGMIKADLLKKPAYYAFQALDKSIIEPTPTNTPIPTNTPSPTATPITNLIQNDSFENTGSLWIRPWYFNLQNNGDGSVSQVTNTKVDGTYSVKTTINRANTNNIWYVQLSQPGISLTAGRQYTLTFYAKASVKRSISVALQMQGGQWTIYLDKPVSITTSWNKYTVIFTQPVNDPNVQLSFNLAGKTGNVWFDKITLR